jgi:hypothetical protein
MGLDPFRKQRRTALDVVLVILFAAITLAFVLWGFFG